MLDWLPLLWSIIFVDLVLSGDNALVIGAIAAKLPDTLRWAAFLIGGGGAILLRILLTYPVSLLLHAPLLQAIGGCLLLFITARLFQVKPEEAEEKPGKAGRPHRWFRDPKSNFMLAMLTIIMADAMTSLDNIIAVAALARDNQVLLVVGLLVSIALLLLASVLICNVIKRLPLLLIVAGVILTITSAQLILQDQTIQAMLPQTQSLWWRVAISAAALVAMSPFGYRWAREQMAESRV